MSQMKLKTVDLRVGYGSHSVCSPVNFAVGQGELIGIVGINGIGKSTLLRTLAGFQPAISGELFLDGTPLENFTQTQLAQKISVVLTEPIAAKNMAVHELISLGRQPYTNWLGRLSDQDKIQIDRALELLHLQDLKDKKCSALSDGQLQRVLIARAMAQSTDIMLLDEPTTHLDLYHKVEILKILKTMAHKLSKSIIYTTHDIALAIQLCDKILILNNQQNPYNQPCNLILDKHFERLFPAENVAFDPETGSFKVQNIQ
jgi:iron complex transport system ATP-binding protein